MTCETPEQRAVRRMAALQAAATYLSGHAAPDARTVVAFAADLEFFLEHGYQHFRDLGVGERSQKVLQGEKWNS